MGLLIMGLLIGIIMGVGGTILWGIAMIQKAGLWA